MKRLLSILLCIVMMLCMVACGKNANTPSGGNHTQNGSSTAEPSDDEKAQIEKYAAAVSALNSYAEEGYLPAYGDGEDVVYDNDAFACYYKDILEATCIERFVDTQYTADDTINWNRQEILDNIVIIEDVLLSNNRVSEDPLGNKKEYGSYYSYDLDGNLVEITSNHDYGYYLPYMGWHIENIGGSNGKIIYIYEDSRVSKIEFWGDGKIKSTITPTYNENGLKVKDLVRWSNSDPSEEEYTYTHDSAGRITTATVEYSNNITFKYEYNYDAEGHLIYHQQNAPANYAYAYHDIINCEYNDDYSMCTIDGPMKGSSSCTNTVSFDEKGNVLTWKESDESGWVDTYELSYGDYYIYKPAVQE